MSSVQEPSRQSEAHLEELIDVDKDGAALESYASLMSSESKGAVAKGQGRQLAKGARRAMKR